MAAGSNAPAGPPDDGEAEPAGELPGELGTTEGAEGAEGADERGELDVGPGLAQAAITKARMSRLRGCGIIS
jgi:hypothetical protein